jgi:hypothetical protein
MVKQSHGSYPRSVVMQAVMEYYNGDESGEVIAEKYKITRGSLMYHFHKYRKKQGIPRGQFPNMSGEAVVQETTKPVYLGGGFQNINMSPTSSIKPLPKSIDDAIKNMDNRQDHEPVKRASSYKAQRSPEEILAGCGGRRGSLLNVVKVSAKDGDHHKESKPHKRSKRIKLTDADFIDPITGQFTVKKL